MARAVAVFRDNAIERARLEQTAQAEQQQRETRQRRVDTLIGTVPHFRVRDPRGGRRQCGAHGRHREVARRNCARRLEPGHQRGRGLRAGFRNVQNVAGAAEELTSSIREIGQQVEKATRVVRRAAELSNASNGEIEALRA